MSQAFRVYLHVGVFVSRFTNDAQNNLGWPNREKSYIYKWNSVEQAVQLYTNKISLDLNETGSDSVRISRNKLGYYSGLAVVPNDVVIALGTGASVGKAGEKKGGSRYQESVAEAEWDFFFSGGGVLELL